ncbi:unnamed protein product, partial [Scytosiphon promiscuus]
MSHEGAGRSNVTIGGGGCSGGGLNLSTTSTAGAEAAVTVAFDYGAEPLAAQDSPSGTGGFLYTVPSPSPTAPSCSLRLSGANGSGDGPLRAEARSPTVIERRRLVWDGSSTSSSSSSSSGGSSSNGSNNSTPAKRPRMPFGGTRTSPPSNRADGGGASFAPGGVRSSPTTPLLRLGEERENNRGTEAICRGPISQQHETWKGAGKGGVRLPMGTAEEISPSRRPLTKQRKSELDVPAAAAAEIGPTGLSGNGLFAALLENISLSQMLPSQGTTQGTTGTQGDHVGSVGAAEAEGGGSTRSGRGGGGCTQGRAPAATEGVAGTQDQGEEREAEDEHEGARRQQEDRQTAAGLSQPIDDAVEGIVPRQEEEGLWGRSRLGLVESLALQDSEDDGGSRSGSEAHASYQACASPLGARCDEPLPLPPEERDLTAAVTAEAARATGPRPPPAQEGSGASPHHGEGAEAPPNPTAAEFPRDTPPAQRAPAASLSPPPAVGQPSTPVPASAADPEGRASSSAG